MVKKQSLLTKGYIKGDGTRNGGVRYLSVSTGYQKEIKKLFRFHKTYIVLSNCIICLDF